MAFYGAIEQVLTGWIFDVLPGAPEDVDQAKAFVVETICGGLEVAPRPSDDPRPCARVGPTCRRTMSSSA